VGSVGSGHWVAHQTVSSQMISDRAKKLILDFENDPSDYLGRPEWPGGDSGVTIGFGWDLGHTPLPDTQAAWSALPADDLDALLAVSGRKGEAARTLLPDVANVRIPYAIALDVFTRVTLPTWEARTLRIYPQAAALGGDCLGALVSLVFNRGASIVGPRRVEMAGIKTALAEGQPELVAPLLLQMRRLWPDTPGLQRRRTAEAQLFAAGLRE
jgi:hypothetical protein